MNRCNSGRCRRDGSTELQTRATRTLPCASVGVSTRQQNGGEPEPRAQAALQLRGNSLVYLG